MNRLENTHPMRSVDAQKLFEYKANTEQSSEDELTGRYGAVGMLGFARQEEWGMPIDYSRRVRRVQSLDVEKPKMRGTDVADLDWHGKREDGMSLADLTD